MMHTIKNSLFSKVLQVLLIGYFLISSINLTSTFYKASAKENEVYSSESFMKHVLKKIFKCCNYAEEYESLDAKMVKGTKSLLTADYLLPFDYWMTDNGILKGEKDNCYKNPASLSCNFYNKIHVPPPNNV